MEKRIERKIEREEAEAKKADAEAQTPSEKWKPNRKEEAKTQDAREKVYSDFLDQQKIEAIRKGDTKRYNTVERDFLRKYKKVALDPNLNSSVGAPYKSEDVDQEYTEQLTDQREFIKARMQDLRHHDRMLDVKDSLREIDSFAEKKRNENYLRTREDREKVNAQYKSEIRNLNEDFLYRQEFAKRNPQSKRALEVEESIMTKTFRNATNTDLAFERELRENKDNFAFSDKKLGNDFSENLSKGDIVKGLLKRKQQLKEGQSQKDLSEIAQGSDPASKDLYKAYINHQKKPSEKTQDISEREREFLAAVEKNYASTSSTSQKTFQDYEDYKRRLQTGSDEFADIDNSVTDIDDDMSTRDWYSKIWTGKITNEEFGDYMFESYQTKDKIGVDTTNYQQKKNPGYGKEDFLTMADRQRLESEMLEVKRRQSIAQGLCTEANSHEYVQNIIEEYKVAFKDMLKPSNRKHLDEYHEILKAISAGEQTREYYFDSNQGVSLEDHLDSVKKVYPNAKIESYIDDDGFTVVKRTSQTEYKYNLNDLLNYAPTEVERKYHKGVKQMIDENQIEIKGNLIKAKFYR